MADTKKYDITVVATVGLPRGPVRSVAAASSCSRTRSRITNTGTVAGAARQPALDHHRRRAPRAGSAGARASSASSRCSHPGESFEYTSGASHPDRRRARCAAATRWWPRTARPSTRRFRRSRCRFRASCIDVGIRVGGPSAAQSRPRCRRAVAGIGAASPSRRAHRPPRRSPTSSSQRHHRPPAESSPSCPPRSRPARVRPRGCRRRRPRARCRRRRRCRCLRAGARRLRHRAAAGRRRPPVAPPITAAAPPSLPARYEAVAWSALPGWTDDRVAEAWPAFRAGCARAGRHAGDPRRSGRRPAPPRRRSTAATPPRCARSSRASLPHTACVAADGARHRDDHRLLRAAARAAAARSRARFARAALRGARRPADHRPRVAPPRAQGPAAARAPRRQARRAVLDARRHRARRGAGRRQGAGLRRRPGRGVLPADPGLGPRRLAGRQRDARRLRRPERPPVPLDRPRADRPRRTHARAGVDAGHQGVGPRATRTSCRRCSTRTRATSSSARCRRRRRARSTRRSTGRSARSACRCCASARWPSTRAASRSARRCTWRRRYPLSTRPLERLVLAQDTGGAIRGAVRGDFFWGFGDEAGRQAGRMKQDGRMWLLWPKGAPLPASPR